MSLSYRPDGTVIDGTRVMEVVTPYEPGLLLVFTVSWRLPGDTAGLWSRSLLLSVWFEKVDLHVAPITVVVKVPPRALFIGG